MKKMGKASMTTSVQLVANKLPYKDLTSENLHPFRYCNTIHCANKGITINVIISLYQAKLMKTKHILLLKP